MTGLLPTTSRKIDALERHRFNRYRLVSYLHCFVPGDVQMVSIQIETTLILDRDARQFF
jgi:hypothetical protein